MSHDMRNPAFCICENKDADQLWSNCAADQRLSFRFTDSNSLFFLNPKFQASSCTAQFVSDQVRNPEDWFSHNEAHMSPVTKHTGLSSGYPTRYDPAT